jgi:hypothetical protein
MGNSFFRHICIAGMYLMKLHCCLSACNRSRTAEWIFVISSIELLTKTCEFVLVLVEIS